MREWTWGFWDSGIWCLAVHEAHDAFGSRDLAGAPWVIQAAWDGQPSLSFLAGQIASTPASLEKHRERQTVALAARLWSRPRAAMMIYFSTGTTLNGFEQDPQPCCLISEITSPKATTIPTDTHMYEDWVKGNISFVNHNFPSGLSVGLPQPRSAACAGRAIWSSHIVFNDLRSASAQVHAMPELPETLRSATSSSRLDSGGGGGHLEADQEGAAKRELPEGSMAMRRLPRAGHQHVQSSRATEPLPGEISVHPGHGSPANCTHQSLSSEDAGRAADPHEERPTQRGYLHRYDGEEDHSGGEAQVQDQPCQKQSHGALWRPRARHAGSRSDAGHRGQSAEPKPHRQGGNLLKRLPQQVGLQAPPVHEPDDNHCC